MGTLYHVPIIGTMHKTITSSEYQRLVKHLIKAREASGLSMRDVASELSQPHTFVHKVEVLERRLDVYEYVKLREVLGIDPHDGIDILIK